MSTTSAGSVQYINPEGLPPGRGYTQVVAVSGPVKTTEAQTAVDASGRSSASTSRQTGKCSRTSPAGAAGANGRLSTEYLRGAGEPIEDAFGAAMRCRGGRPTSLPIRLCGWRVSARPCLVMIDARPLPG
jgi:hypothetical protein